MIENAHPFAYVLSTRSEGLDVGQAYSLVIVAFECVYAVRTRSARLSGPCMLACDDDDTLIGEGRVGSLFHY
jgi:hypothetical protein